MTGVLPKLLRSKQT